MATARKPVRRRRRLNPSQPTPQETREDLALMKKVLRQKTQTVRGPYRGMAEINRLLGLK